MTPPRPLCSRHRPPSRPEPERPGARAARLCPSAELPPGIPPGQLYMLFELTEFHLGADAEGRPVAELAVPTENWRAIAGVKSGPSAGDRVLVVAINQHQIGCAGRCGGRPSTPNESGCAG